MTLLVFDMGGSAVKYGLWQDEQLSDKGQFATPDTWQKMKEELKAIRDSIKKPLEGVGISAPGAVNVAQQQINGISAIPYIHGFNIFAELEALFQLPVTIENDANCVVLAEKWIGNGKDCSSFVCMTIGTGIGGGMFINNKIHVGKNFFAGEFGYIIIEDFEDYNNIPTLSFSSATEPLLKQVALAKEMKFKDINGLKVFKMIENGDEVVIEAYRKWLRKLCIGINNVGFSIDPEKFLIGGGVSGAPRLIPDIKEELRKINPYTERWKIETCKHFNSSGKIGAVYNYLVRNDLV